MEPQNPSPEQKVLQNPMILQQIFQTENLPAKNLRLVCQLWNQIVLSLSEPKLGCKLMSSCGPEDPLNSCPALAPLQLFCIKMEPKLARCISGEGYYRHCKTDLHPTPPRISCAASRLRYFCEKYSQIIEEIIFTFEEEDDLMWTMCKILQNSCPNLNSINFNVYEMRAPRQKMSPLGIKPKLTSIQIEDYNGQKGVLKMTQMIINSAPNLTHFIYHGELYPDLSRCGKLTTITIDMDGSNLSYISSCAGANGLNKMLDQVKNHLQVLVLLSRVPDQDNEDDDDDVPQGSPLVARIAFKLPEMPSLTIFENELVDVFTCGDNLEHICTARLPSLETLKLGKSHPFYFPSNLDDLLRGAAQSKNLFSGVKNLHLKDVRETESINGLGEMAPNLETLSITEWESYEKENDNKFAHLVQWVACCDGLPPTLKNFDVQAFPWWDFPEVGCLGRKVERMKMFLEVIKRNKVPNVTIKYVKVAEETWQWMDPFIRDNQIPIKFERGYRQES